jgi:hypothetical protein
VALLPYKHSSASDYSAYSQHFFRGASETLQLLAAAFQKLEDDLTAIYLLEQRARLGEEKMGSWGMPVAGDSWCQIGMSPLFAVNLYQTTEGGGLVTSRQASSKTSWAELKRLSSLLKRFLFV